MNGTNLRNALLAEFGGTAALLAIVVGSGIMGESLAQGNAAVALLANSLATGAGLYVLISLLGPVSGAHFNPLVTLVLWWRGGRAGKAPMGYVLAQLAGAVVGVWAAHRMFDLPIWQLGTKIRAGTGQWFSEAVATAGLLATILLGLRERAWAIPALVGSYIAAAYWFTASTSFANPAVTVARALTNTFAGIRLEDVAGFVLSQLGGAIAILAAMHALRVDPAVSKSA